MTGWEEKRLVGQITCCISALATRSTTGSQTPGTRSLTGTHPMTTSSSRPVQPGQPRQGEAAASPVLGVEEVVVVEVEGGVREGGLRQAGGV